MNVKISSIEEKSGWISNSIKPYLTIEVDKNGKSKKAYKIFSFCVDTN